MAYDPALDLLYIGVGNGSFYNQELRSPGGGDNLYLSSIVAIRPKTGAYVWHFQETPGETWDYTATQPIILADLVVDGRPRKVLLHAPKNGFFYVIDRTNGRFISGRNFVPVNWATGLDPKTGRPIENPAARFDRTGKPFFLLPNPGGAHSWYPMAHDARSKLVFLPVVNGPFPMLADRNWKPSVMGFDTGVDFSILSDPATARLVTPELLSTVGQPGPALLAWDPVAQKEVWRVRQTVQFGGVLATAGGVLFGGQGGRFVASDMKDGRALWSFDAQTGIVAGPISFMAGGEQYVAVLAGAGASYPVAAGTAILPNVSRLLVFKLDGTAKLPPAPALRIGRIAEGLPPEPQSPDLVKRGTYLFMNHCMFCHQATSAIGPDLTFSPTLGDARAWRAIVRDGALAKRGMVGWSTMLSDADIDAIRAMFVNTAQAYQARGKRAAAGVHGRPIATGAVSPGLRGRNRGMPALGSRFRAGCPSGFGGPGCGGAGRVRGLTAPPDLDFRRPPGVGAAQPAGASRAPPLFWALGGGPSSPPGPQYLVRLRDERRN